MKATFFLVGMLAAAQAFAIGPTPEATAPEANATSIAGAAAVAGAAAGAAAEATNISVNHNALSNRNENSNFNVAQTGDSTAGAQATASNGGNSLSVNEQHVRNAPAIGQGSFAIHGCGVAGNVGGSNTNGAGFLGIAFTPEQCYDFMLAQAYQSAGAYQAACEVLNASKAGQRAARRGVSLPICAPPAPTPTPTPPVVTTLPVDTSSYVTREELREREERIIRTLRSK